MCLLTDLDTVIHQNSGDDAINKDEYFVNMLFPLYYDFYRFIFSFTKNKNLTEDVIQSSILLAYENIGKLRDKSKFKSWFFTIGKREYLKVISNNNKFVDLPLELVQPDDNNPENVYIDTEIIIEMILIINKLSAQDRLIFLFRDFGELQFKQIASTLEMNDTTVRTRYKRIKTKIAQIYNNSDNTN